MYLLCLPGYAAVAHMACAADPKFLHSMEFEQRFLSSMKNHVQMQHCHSVQRT